jgi:Tfp pilus assembly protein PilO
VNRLGASSNAGDALMLWLATIAVACAGYYIAFVALAGAIDDQHDMTGRVRDTIRANAEIVAQQSALEREQRTVDQRARGLDLRADRAALVATFVQTAAHVAGERGVSLDRVDARAAAPASAAAANPPGGMSFEAIPLEVSLRGRYDALLAAIRELALAPLPMQIEIAAVERTASGPDGAATAAPLTARLHLILQHLSDDAPAGPAQHPIP